MTTTIRTGTCVDCDCSFEHLAPTGCVPKRCPDCREVVKSAYRAISYQRHGDKRRAEARAYHYARTPRQQSRPCKSCGVEISFTMRRGRNPKLCESCRIEARRMAVKKHREANPDSRWVYELKKYGLDEQSLLAMYEKQEGKCAICHVPKPLRGGNSPMHIDHDHSTGVVRGLLCASCNLALGAFRDDSSLLTAAISYLGAQNG